MKKQILKYTIIAILAGLSIGLNKLEIPITQYIVLTFYALPLLFAGCCLDLTGSLLVGALTGVILQLTSKYGISITSPFWALAPIGWTMTSFAINYLFKKVHLIIRVIIIVIISSLVATALNTFAMIMEGLLMNDEYYALANIAVNLPMRLVVMTIMFVPYALLLYVLVDRVGPLYKKHFEKEASQSLESEAPSEIDE